MHPSLDLTISKVLALVRLPVPGNLAVGYVDGTRLIIVEVVFDIEEVGRATVALDFAGLAVPEHIKGGTCGNAVVSISQQSATYQMESTDDSPSSSRCAIRPSAGLIKDCVPIASLTLQCKAGERGVRLML